MYRCEKNSSFDTDEYTIILFCWSYYLHTQKKLNNAYYLHVKINNTDFWVINKIDNTPEIIEHH